MKKRKLLYNWKEMRRMLLLKLEKLIVIKDKVQEVQRKRQRRTRKIRIRRRRKKSLKIQKMTIIERNYY
jgi:hypothetical protein